MDHSGAPRTSLGTEPQSIDRASHRIRETHGTTVAVLVVGAIVGGILVLLSVRADSDNEDRLLRERVGEAGAVLEAAVPGVEAPLAAAVEAVEASDGADQTTFERVVTSILERDPQYVSGSLWRVDREPPVPELVIGTAPKLSSMSDDEIRRVLDIAVTTDRLSVVDLLAGDQPRLGYAYTTAEIPIRFVAYVESALPPDRVSEVEPGSAFADMDFAIYLGERPDAASLVVASTSDLPLPGRRDSESVAFGNNVLLLVMTPKSKLGGPLMAALPWIVAAVAAVMTIGAASLVERLLRRRDEAERLSAENASLYQAQRSVVRTLQERLLPDRLPAVNGLEFAARYLPGSAELDVGGDWYDVIEGADGRVVIVVGDVSGRGAGAAVLMGVLRSSVRAFASEGHEPAQILERLNALVDVRQDGHFATVLCLQVDPARAGVTLASAGHPSPLLLSGGEVRQLDFAVGPPIGVATEHPYEASHVTTDGDPTLLLFTDGLFERRGESVDDGMERLMRTVSELSASSIDELVGTVVRAQSSGMVRDDAAILGVRWTSPTTA